MSAYNFRIICSVLFIAVFCTSSFTQGHHNCSTSGEYMELFNISDKSELQQYQKFEKQFLRNFGNKSNSVDTVLIHFHVGISDGWAKIELDTINRNLDNLNSYFINANIYFKTNDVTYEEFLWDFDPQRDGDKVSKIRRKGMVNVFYKNGSGGSYASSVGLFAGGTNAGTLRHEMGHIFGLYHTHGRYNTVVPIWDEFVSEFFGFPFQVWMEGAVRYHNEQRDDNNNGIFDCYETGDDVCDTSPEHVLSDDFNTEGEYIADHLDFFGDRFKPDLTNVMSYGPGSDFSPGQYARMRFIYENKMFYLHCDKCLDCEDEFTVTRSDNLGSNSFPWALDCAEILKTDDEVKHIILDVPGNEILLVRNREYVLRSDNYTIESINGKTIINSEVNKFGTKNEIYFAGDNLILKNIHFKNLIGIYINDPTDGDFTKRFNNITIQDCIFEDLTNRPKFNNIDNFKLVGNQFIGDESEGISLNSIHNGEIINTKIESPNRGGIHLRESSDIVIKDNKISNVSWQGIFSESNVNIQIEGNKFYDIEDAGVVFSNNENVTIVSNEFGIANTTNKNGSIGLYFIGESNNNIRIESNQIENWVLGLNFNSEESNNVTIKSNEISFVKSLGLLGHSFNDLVVDDNKIHSNDGIGVSMGALNKVIISNNQIYDNLGGGYFINSTENVEIFGNSIYDNGTTGLDISDSKDVKIGGDPSKSNTIQGHIDIGINIENSEFEMQANSIYCNGKGIRISNEGEPELNLSINDVTEERISGIGSVGSLIEVYGNKNECEDCQFENLIGSTIVDDNGEWQIENFEYIITDAERINAIIHDVNHIKIADQCILADVVSPTFEIEENGKVDIYPNPTNDLIQILLSESLLADSQYVIYNLIGAKVQSGVLNNGLNQLSLSTLTSGIYNIVIENSEDKYIGRILLMDD